MSDTYKLILSDVDGTLLDKQYKFNTSPAKLTAAVHRAQKRESLVGLSSDSPAKTLQSLHAASHMQGPIVAEKGAIVSLPGNRSIRVNSITSLFPKMQSLLTRLVKNKETISLLFSDNPNQIVREFVVGSRNIEDGSAKKLIVVNNARVASLSFFGLSHHEDSWGFSPDLVEKISSELLALAQDQGIAEPADLLLDNNPEYGICIVHHKLTDKASSLPILREWYPQYQIIMIGNSLSDWHDSTIQHYAVRNAEPRFKKLCKRTSNQDLTRGVIEVLDSFSRPA